MGGGCSSLVSLKNQLLQFTLLLRCKLQAEEEPDPEQVSSETAHNPALSALQAHREAVPDLREL